MSDSPKGLNQLNRVLLQTLMSKDAANIVADRLEKLERENARLQMELDASCNAEELRQVRVENAALRSALKTALAIESLDETNLEELIARCRCIMTQTKEAQP